MKTRILAMLLAVVMAVSLTACTGSEFPFVQNGHLRCLRAHI